MYLAVSIAWILFAGSDARPEPCGLRCNERQGNCTDGCRDDAHCVSRCAERFGACQAECPGGVRTEAPKVATSKNPQELSATPEAPAGKSAAHGKKRAKKRHH